MPAPDRLRARRAAVAGMLVNIALAAAKLLAGLLGHSFALVADAVESMADILGSAVIWGGLKFSSRPADTTHPYGHGKAEALAALVVSAMILFAGLGIAAEAIHQIITPHHTPAPYTLVVLIVVVVTKEILFRVVRRIASDEQSTAAHADAWHHRADAITSLAAFIGISIALIGGKGYEPADDWAALFASAVILWNGAKLARQPLHELLDAEPTEIVEEARRIAAAVPGVRLIEKTFARTSGSRHWIDMHVHVDPSLSVADAHAISGKVKAAIREAIPTVENVLVHIEPAEQQ
ncbi:MAG TPA: cation diffusion facilitator family transporter [Phycisphaerales bacterium]|nr:cation diffusion facilitator family transporter [Phycisphaerales bacterium]